MTESYAICNTSHGAQGLVCQPSGWKNATFKIDEDPNNKDTWGNVDWLFSNYSFTKECPERNCCIRLEAKSKRYIMGISDKTNLPISIASYNSKTGMYQTPLLCDNKLTLVPAWTLNDMDKTLKFVCQIQYDKMKTFRNDKTLPKYVRTADLFNDFQNMCFAAFFNGNYVCTIGIVISILLAAQIVY